jgi:hypothetical protein
MHEELKALCDKHGVASVLCELRNVISREADDLEELGDPADAETVKKLEAVASAVLAAAVAYDAMATFEQ